MPGRDGDQITVRASVLQTRPVRAQTQLDESEPTRRRVIITREIVNKYGYTAKCQGCTAINRGIAKQPHSEACISRIEGKLREEGNANLQRADERVNDQLADRVRKQVEKG